MVRERTGCLVPLPTNKVRNNRKQAYLSRVVGERVLRVRYRNQPEGATLIKGGGRGKRVSNKGREPSTDRMVRERTGCLVPLPTNKVRNNRKQAYLSRVVGVKVLRVRKKDPRKGIKKGWPKPPCYFDSVFFALFAFFCGGAGFSSSSFSGVG